METLRGSCLCGDVVWETTGPLEFMTHCHCSRCRKAHGSAFATFAMCQPGEVRLLRGSERIVRYESSPGLFRRFCGSSPLCGAR